MEQGGLIPGRLVFVCLVKGGYNVNARSGASIGRVLGLSFLLYLLWCLATWFFEGRISLLQQPTPLGRAVYVIIANILIGIFATAWLMRSSLAQGFTSLDEIGFRSLRRTLVAVVLALIGGFALFVLLGPPSLEPLVVWNGFAQTLPVTIAELLVCWVAIGANTEAATRSRGRIVSIVLAIIAADVAFGVYHFAHSAPFNQWGMVLFLMVIGLFTSLVYFLTRDVYAAIIVHNFLGMKGVMGSIDLAILRQPLIPLYSLVALSVVALVAVHIWLRRQATKGSEVSGKPRLHMRPVT